jgi:AcrR family transcriptional regulator
MLRVTTFQRARSDEQREVRRRKILAVAAEMVAEMTVAEISLNELSRRVGLAKSNVLRYFDSREAILLDLLDRAWRDWLDRLAAELPRVVDPATPVADRYPRIAAAVTTSVAGDRLFCELVSVSSAVLEHNISPDVARAYKVSAIANTHTFAALIRDHLDELGEQGAFYFAAGTLVAITGLWPLTQPSEAMLCVYEDPQMAALRLDFRTALDEMLATLLAGCLARWASA